METLNDLTAKCIRCGFCLESCPTFSLTGSELESPRGRIYLVKSAIEGKLAWEDAAPHLDRCLGCRACEPACPSGVEYGKILELARETIKPSWIRRLFVNILTRPFWFKVAQRLKPPKWLIRQLRGDRSTLGFVNPNPEFARKWPFLAHQANRGEEVVFLEGCVMREMYPGVNQATVRTLARLGFELAKTDLGCCGALHGHSGQLSSGKAHAGNLEAKAGGKRVVTNSAGCGSWLKDNGIEALDISELLGDLPLESYQSQPIKVTYHDACHLAHGQRITAQPRDILNRLPNVELVEMDQPSRCCGSAGTYSVFQPDLATKLVNLKVASIGETKADIVVLGNPGCHSWISQHIGPDVRVMHLVEFVEALASGVDP
ncbi:MAG: heterodisulfide reductase-related iron-sulfur binding cluster [Fimbriimonadaceae bacterium]